MHFWYEVKRHISCFLNPRQKWLTKKIPRTWCDKTELIPLILFECLVNYIEDEEGLRDDYNYTDDIEKGYITQEQVNDITTRDSELRGVYNYIKHERDELKKQLDNAYPKWIIPTSEAFVKVSPTTYQLRPAEERYGKSYQEAYSEVNRIEEIIREKDMNAMQTIVKYHEYLWT